MAKQPAEEAVVLIHGSSGTEQGQARAKLVRGFLEESQAFSVTRKDDQDIAGQSGIRLAVHDQSGKLVKHVDIFDAYWGDLRTRLSDQPATRKAFDGLRLVLYWLNPRVALAFSRSAFLTISMLIGVVALLIWFAVVGVVGLGLLAGALEGVEHAWIKGFVSGVEGFVATVLSNRAYSLIALLAVLAPITGLVDLLYLTRRYLRNERTGREDDARLRTRIRARAKLVLDRVAQSERYSRITLVAHSLGTVVAVDLLAERVGPEPSLRFISLGGSARLLSVRSRWLRTELERCLANDHIDQWVDFYSPNDWLAGEAAKKGTYACNYTQQPIRFEGGLWDAINGTNHERYLEDQRVAETILGAPLPAVG